MLRDDVIGYLHPDLGVMNAVHVRQVGLYAHIAEPAILRDRRRQIVIYVAARIILHDVLAKERVYIDDHRRPQQMNPAERDVIGPNLLPLILTAVLLIVCIGNLEPRTPREKVKVQRIILIGLKIEPVEDPLIIADVMQRRKFR